MRETIKCPYCRTSKAVDVPPDLKLMEVMVAPVWMNLTCGSCGRDFEWASGQKPRRIGGKKWWHFWG